MQLDNQIALAFGLVTAILILVGLLTKSAIIYRRLSCLTALCYTNDDQEIYQCQRDRRSTMPGSTSATTDLEMNAPALTTNSNVQASTQPSSNIDHCSTKATNGDHSRRLSTITTTPAQPHNLSTPSPSSNDQSTSTSASEHSSSLTQANLATHNDTNTDSVVGRHHIESCLKQQAEINRRHDSPDPQAWKELCRDDEVALEIEALNRAARRDG